MLPFVGTNSILRRIDLTSNILAPVSTGLILDYGSTLIGVVFIACWNIVSVFVEYTMLSSVFRSCPALAEKAVDVARINSNSKNSEPDLANDDLSEFDGDGTILVPRVKTSRSLKTFFNLVFDKVKSRVRVIRLGLKLFFQQRVALAGIGLAFLHLTVLGFDSITTAYAYSQHVSVLALGILTGAGALTGIFGTFLFPALRRLFGLVRTGLISGSIQIFFLLFCMASVWAPGHPGHLLDLGFREHGSHGNTGAVRGINSSIVPTESHIIINPTRVNFCGKSTATITFRSTASIHPTAALLQVSNSSVFVSLKKIMPSRTLILSYSTSILKVNNTGNSTRKSKKHSTVSESKNSIISLGLLMCGIIMSRIGLWITDLVVTQLFQENVAEQERGIVSGVQNSFNSIMDMGHYVMVIVAPKPEQFGLLIIISVSMVSSAFAFYSRFAWSHRKRLMQFEKLSRWSTSSESIEGSSRRLGEENRSNSRSDVSIGGLSVENDNYYSPET